MLVLAGTSTLPQHTNSLLGFCDSVMILILFLEFQDSYPSFQYYLHLLHSPASQSLAFKLQFSLPVYLAVSPLV